MNGNFRAHGISATLCETKEGKPQVAAEFELHDDEHKGKRLGWYGQLSSDASIEFTVKALRAAGWTGTELSDITFDGRECVLVVEEEQYEDEAGVHSRTKVKYVNPAGGVAVKAPMDPDKAKAFAAQMKGKVLAIDQKIGKPAAAPAPAAQRQPNPSPADSDIPF
jgi:ribosomal protein L12E/L44/L45/RPP1/RPP2